MKKRKATPLVEVTWVDACSSHGWYTDGELQECRLVAMTTVGYMVRRNKTDIALAQGRSHHFGNGPNKWSEVWTIPAQWIKRVRRLK